MFSLNSYKSSNGRDISVINTDPTLPSLKTILPPGQKAKDYNVTFTVEVFDALGAASSVMLVVKVRSTEVTNLPGYPASYEHHNSCNNKSRMLPCSRQGRKIFGNLSALNYRRTVLFGLLLFSVLSQLSLY